MVLLHLRATWVWVDFGTGTVFWQIWGSNGLWLCHREAISPFSGAFYPNCQSSKHPNTEVTLALFPSATSPRENKGTSQGRGTQAYKILAPFSRRKLAATAAAAVGWEWGHLKTNSIQAFVPSQQLDGLRLPEKGNTVSLKG